MSAHGADVPDSYNAKVIMGGRAVNGMVRMQFASYS